MTGRYDGAGPESEFQPGSRGRILRNRRGIGGRAVLDLALIHELHALLMQDEATHFPVGAGNAGSELMVDAQYSTSGGRCLWIHCSTEGRRHW